MSAEVAGSSRLAGAHEERVLARLRALRSDLIDPTIAFHHDRVVKRTATVRGRWRLTERRTPPHNAPAFPLRAGRAC
jgi:hypothetical protein